MNDSPTPVIVVTHGDLTKTTISAMPVMEASTLTGLILTADHPTDGVATVQLSLTGLNLVAYALGQSLKAALQGLSGP